ncbi:MAG: OmpH family outer membrane protein [Bacteroidetes bacterium]|nr:OmpH family outer membrane protein [Bacteroidota bacterium]
MKQLSLSIILMGLFALTASAQKFGHINSQEILSNMPENAEMQASIESQTEELRTELTRMQQEFQTKLAEYQSKSATWPKAILEQKERELQSLEQGMQEFSVTAQNDLVQLEQSLLMPVIERIQAAIDEVGSENGFTYIFDTTAGAVVYTGGEDVGPLVRAKLGM